MSVVLGSCGLPLILAPLAFILGLGVKRDAVNGGWPEPGNNKVGRIIAGIVSAIALVLAILFVLGRLAG
jgi:hypothetical protein